MKPVCLTLALLPALAAAADIHYLPTPDIIANPERGFYHQVDCEVPINPQHLQNLRLLQGDTLTMCVFRLDDAIHDVISQARLDFFQQQMDAVRAAGAKVILRFSYNFSDTPVDAPPALVQVHLNQLAPYLAYNKDVIAVVQAGFVGSWGEWAYSNNFGRSTRLSVQNWSDRTNLVNKLLQTVPPERMVQLRTPAFKRRIAGSAALAPGEAFNGSARARIGHHNDCFLGSGDDRGTYADIPVEYPYLEAETRYLPMGGETCAVARPRSDCPTALAEMARFHWSYLNAGFHEDVIAGFKTQGCFGEIRKKLGYRFVLEKGRYADSAKPGGTLAVSFTIRNEGWAAPFNPRDVVFLLRGTTSGALYRFRLNTDPRLWLPGQAVTVSQNVALPASMPKDHYETLLMLSDPAPTLRDRPEYAIRLANIGVWEAATGFNRLHHIVSVGAAAH